MTHQQLSAFTFRRVSIRSLFNLVGRGSYGLTLAASLSVQSATMSSDLALALAIVTAANLVSNAGIPTLLMREHRHGHNPSRIAGMFRSYISLTFIAALAVSVGLFAATESATFSLAAAVLLVAQSIYTGFEYWCLGVGTHEYDSFLRRTATTQSLLSLLAPVGMVLTSSSDLTLLLLSASYGAGVTLSYGPAAGIRRTMPHVWGGLHLRTWWREAVVIGSGTALASLFYAADVLLLRVAVPAGDVAAYRLAVMAVAFYATLMPIGLFVLADASAGITTRVRKILIASVSVTVVTCLTGLLILVGFDAYAAVGFVLALLAPLSAFRIMTQTAVSVHNAEHRELVVAMVFGIGCTLWLGAGLGIYLTNAAPTLAAIAALQLGIEAATLLALIAWIPRRGTRAATSRAV